ncbi:hypothetical protein ABWK34_18825, partial [Bacillus safensis]|uniref:hypothetical protein n=1 Tax=Bacillus safensis TaxID=561879 RepID=UPI003398D89B
IIYNFWVISTKNRLIVLLGGCFKVFNWKSMYRRNAMTVTTIILNEGIKQMPKLNLGATYGGDLINTYRHLK